MQNKIRSPADCSDNEWQEKIQKRLKLEEKMSNNLLHGLDNIKTKEELCKSIKLQNFRMIQCEQSMILREQESH